MSVVTLSGRRGKDVKKVDRRSVFLGPCVYSKLLRPDNRAGKNLRGYNNSFVIRSGPCRIRESVCVRQKGLQKKVNAGFQGSSAERKKGLEGSKSRNEGEKNGSLDG